RHFPAGIAPHQGIIVNHVVDGFSSLRHGTALPLSKTEMNPLFAGRLGLLLEKTHSHFASHVTRLLYRLFMVIRSRRRHFAGIYRVHLQEHGIGGWNPPPSRRTNDDNATMVTNLGRRIAGTRFLDWRRCAGAGSNPGIAPFLLLPL